MEKITKRTMFAAIIANASDMTVETEDGVITIAAADVAAFAQNEIDLLDKKAAKAKTRAAEKRAEGDELTAAVETALSADEFEPIATIAARIEGEDVTISKVTYRLTQLVKAGKAEKQEVTIPATEGNKSRKVQGYKAC